eukprot:GHVR01064606.1.p1 GENE.GHVR01064606.1~~GHVR01064606.1.p1  ORF type:complete len:226 (-),score=36.01 GHVR01064606.1:956-1633(-)
MSVSNEQQLFEFVIVLLVGLLSTMHDNKLSIAASAEAELHRLLRSNKFSKVSIGSSRDGIRMKPVIEDKRGRKKAKVPVVEMGQTGDSEVQAELNPLDIEKETGSHQSVKRSPSGTGRRKRKMGGGKLPRLTAEEVIERVCERAVRRQMSTREKVFTAQSSEFVPGDTLDRSPLVAVYITSYKEKARKLGQIFILICAFYVFIISILQVHIAIFILVFFIYIYTE